MTDDTGTTTIPTRELRYDVPALRHELIDSVEALAAHLGDDRLADLLGAPLARRLRGWGGAVRNRMAETFTLVVIGDFNRGKSTLVNALLEASVAPTSITPETVTINRIQDGPEARAEAHLVNGLSIPLTPEELRGSMLETLIARLPAPISHARVWAPFPAWLRGIQIVDTPGAGIAEQFNQQVHTYLTEADAVLYVVSALAPLSQSEQDFLRASLLPQDFPKVFVLMNQMDTAQTEDDARQLLEHLRGKINRLLPEAHVFGVSALDELCRQRDLPRPNPARAATLERDFAAFRANLQQSVLLNREWIQLDRAVGWVSQSLNDLESRLSMLRAALYVDREQLGTTMADCRNENSTLAQAIRAKKRELREEINAMAVQANEWMDAFMDRLEEDAIPNIADFAVEDLQRHYHFFLIDTLRQALNDCMAVHGSLIVERARAIREAVEHELSPIPNANLAGARVAHATFNTVSWGNMDTIQLVLKLTPINLISDLIISQVRKSGQRATFQQKVREAMPALRAALNEQVRDLYTTIANEMDRRLDEAYRRDLEASLEAMGQAEDLHRRGEQEITQAHAHIRDILATIAETQTYLTAFKQRLHTEELLQM